MTKKDYELIASVLQDRTLHLHDCKVRALADRFATALSADNPRFDRARFLAACGVED